MSSADASCRVEIDCYHDKLDGYADGRDPTGRAIVAVDVFRSTTTLVTAVELGRVSYPVASLVEAADLARQLPEPLLVGELGGFMPYHFDLTNSPARVALAGALDRPMVLLSTSGTPLLAEAVATGRSVFAACLRNVSAQVAYAVDRFDDVMIVGAGTRGEFREEDQYCSALLAEGFVRAGYEPVGKTVDVIGRWAGAPVEAIADGNSGEYLRSTGQVNDIQYVLEHVDDVQAVFVAEASGCYRRVPV